jgi:hypothetical protein
VPIRRDLRGGGGGGWGAVAAALVEGLVVVCGPCFGELGRGGGWGWVGLKGHVKMWEQAKQRMERGELWGGAGDGAGNSRRDWQAGLGQRAGTWGSMGREGRGDIMVVGRLSRA